MNDTKPSAIKLTSEIGTEMTIELARQTNRINLRLIGVLPGEYLIFHLPKKLFDKGGTQVFSQNAALNVRSLSRGVVFGFKATIINAVNLKEPCLIISYPAIVQNQTIRKTLRVKCLLPARLVIETESIEGTVADISRGGCHYQVKKELFTPEKIEAFQEGNAATFALSLPGVEEEINIPASIVNIATDANKVELGVAFKDVDNSTLKQIDNIIAMSFDISPL